MADIWLMRHGAYEGHRPGYHAPPDAPLSQAGRLQIPLSLPLPDDIAGVVTSPVLRARQTASELALLTGLPVIDTSDLLAEWRAPSCVLGLAPNDYPHAYLAWRARRLDDPSLRCQDGESLADLHNRAARCADFLHQTATSHGPLLAVSHTLLLGVLTRLPQGPTSFAIAARNPWKFTERRPFITPRPIARGPLHQPSI